MGEKIALEVIRHHRLLELYLSQAMGYSWDQVDAEAEKLEHYISEEFEDSIERLLGFPAFDIHGDPIPTRDGQMPATAYETLVQCSPTKHGFSGTPRLRHQTPPCSGISMQMRPAPRHRGSSCFGP